jgi:hypothetical protein
MKTTTTKEHRVTTTTTEPAVELSPEERCRIATVIEFERTIERFKRGVLDGDTEFVAAMTSLVDNMIGDAA